VVGTNPVFGSDECEGAHDGPTLRRLPS